MKWLLVFLLTAAILLLIVVFASRYLVNRLAFFPDTTNVLSAEQLPAGIEVVTIPINDEVVLHNYLLAASGSDRLLIYFHGNAGNIDQRLPSLMALQQVGINVLGVSYRGYGRSTGKPSEKGLYADGDTVWRHATTVMGYRPENIFILGRSIGSTVAIHTAQHKDFAGMVLITPVGSGPRQVAQMGLGPLSIAARGVFDNIAKAPAIRVPTIVIHGTHDEIVPYDSGVAVYEALASEKQLVTVEGGDHNTLQDVFPEQFWPPLLAFLRDH